MSTDENEVLQSATQQIIHFNWFEYIIFFGMLGASALIGIYFGCIHPAQNTVKEYMLGGKRMSTYPIALSMIASSISGITLLGIPAETYLYGTQLYLVCLAITISIILLNIFYLPVLYNLGATSIYEYLERRFNYTTRLVGSLLNILYMILFIPVIIYVPALAFNQVTGVSVNILAPIVCSVCIFYTTLGGLKAVVWSDALQSFFTLTSLFAVMLLGIQSVGGVGNVIYSSLQGERLEFFNFDPDPFKRNTFWTVVVGSVISWTSFLSFYQGAYQRYVALPTYQHARIASFMLIAGLILLKSLSTITGLIIYTKYHDCDPVYTKVVDKVGQILPYFVMDVAGRYRGLSGLFLSGVVSTALSTMSTGLNAAGGAIFEDFIKPLMSKKPTEKQSNFIMKCIVIIIGAIGTSMVFVVANMGTIMQVSITLNGITSGINGFFFIFGMFVPWGNSKGVIAGAAAGFIAVSWIAIGSQIAVAKSLLNFPAKITSIDNCPLNFTFPQEFNVTKFGRAGYGTFVDVADSVPMPYRISYLYISCVGFIVSFTVGTVVSLLTGGQDLTELDPKLIIPQLRWLLSPHMSKQSTEVNLQKYTSVATDEFQTNIIVKRESDKLEGERK